MLGYRIWLCIKIINTIKRTKVWNVCRKTASYHPALNVHTVTSSKHWPRLTVSWESSVAAKSYSTIIIHCSTRPEFSKFWLTERICFSTRRKHDYRWFLKPETDFAHSPPVEISSGCWIKFDDNSVFSEPSFEEVGLPILPPISAPTHRTPTFIVFQPEVLQVDALEQTAVEAMQLCSNENTL